MTSPVFYRGMVKGYGSTRSQVVGQASPGKKPGLTECRGGKGEGRGRSGY